MGSLIKDKESPQIQVCEKPQYALDMLQMIGIIAPSTTIVHNASPIGEDPHEAVSKVAGQFQDIAVIINKYYDLDEAIEVFQILVEEISSTPDSDSVE